MQTSIAHSQFLLHDVINTIICGSLIAPEDTIYEYVICHASWVSCARIRPTLNCCQLFLFKFSYMYDGLGFGRSNTTNFGHRIFQICIHTSAKNGIVSLLFKLTTSDMRYWLSSSLNLFCFLQNVKMCISENVFPNNRFRFHCASKLKVDKYSFSGTE